MKTLLLAAAVLFLPTLAACSNEHVSHSTTEEKGLFSTKVKDTTVRTDDSGNAHIDQTTTKIPNQ